MLHSSYLLHAHAFRISSLGQHGVLAWHRPSWQAEEAARQKSQPQPRQPLMLLQLQLSARRQNRLQLQQMAAHSKKKQRIQMLLVHRCMDAPPSQQSAVSQHLQHMMRHPVSRSKGSQARQHAVVGQTQKGLLFTARLTAIWMP